MIEPTTPVQSIGWIPKARVRSLTKLGLLTAKDLVLHFPHRHEDRSRFSSFPTADTDGPVLVRGEVVRCGYLPYGKWRRGFEAVVRESGALGGEITLRWFNMPHVAKTVAAGFDVLAFARVKSRGRRLIMDFPEFELLGDDEELPVHLNRIVPVHSAGEGISPKKLRELIHRALHEVDLAKIEWITPASSHDADVLRRIHFPDSWEELESARRELVFEELFQMQVLLAQRRRISMGASDTAKQNKSDLMAEFLGSLPFAPTQAQTRAINQVQRGMESSHRMHTLLQGDVGSGKTLVAAAAAAFAIGSGCRAAVMAPTQILAEQHYATLHRWFEPMGVSVALKTGSREEGLGASGPDLFATVPPGLADPPHIIVGTHALLYGDTRIERLGLIVIDEQHKFGVMQRARLAAENPAADILVLTATPIPRTLAQTAYGDLDVVVLDELPPGRGKIISGVRPASKLKDAAIFLRSQLEAGRQVYIVYPLIDESEKVAAKAAKEEFARWSAALTPHACGLLHGRMDTTEKQSVMSGFREGSLRVLISTTVIEVGIDVPNATVMLIENAERFGLAQLHQLRGRVGRGAHTSYCILIPSTSDEDALERLRVLEKTNDGFEVAEADLRFRGPGDVLGTAQTGLPPLRLADLTRDATVIQDARSLANEIFEHDPDLSDPAHKTLRTWIESRALPVLDG